MAYEHNGYMRIENYLNTTREEVESKAFNIWIGVSLGNKYFTKEHIRGYVAWALEFTKERVLVVIADSLYASNLEVLDSKTSGVALRKALAIGDEKYQVVEEIITALPSEQQEKIRVVRWKDILDTSEYEKNLSIVVDAYNHNTAFRDHIRDIAKIGRKDRASRLEKLSEQELDRFCDYVLNEIPPFVNGVQENRNDTVYTLVPYPGLCQLDELCVGLQNKTLFPEIAERLSVTNKMAILDAYVE